MAYSASTVVSPPTTTNGANAAAAQPKPKPKPKSKPKSKGGKAKPLPSFAVNKHGRPYRSFKLTYIAQDGKLMLRHEHTAVNRGRSAKTKASHLGPLRASQKIFDAWCREQSLDEIADVRFCIQEITRGKNNRSYTYEGHRTKLDSPKEITIQGNVITYRYRTHVSAYRPACCATTT